MNPKNKMIKKPAEIQLIIEGGIILGEILENLAYNVVGPGVSTLEVDREAERMIRKAGARPSFKNYDPDKEGNPFPSTICASINEEVVHAPAVPGRILKEGDLFSIDIGMEYPFRSGKRGFYTDTAITVPIGKIKSEAEHIRIVTYNALFEGIKAARAGRTIADIGRAIEKFAKPFGVGIVRALVGHGVGYEVHESPQIPNYYVRALESIELMPGMILALEPMFTLGSYEVDFLDDGWTVSTTDGSLSAHSEHTIIVTDGDPIIATLRPSEKHGKKI